MAFGTGNRSFGPNAVLYSFKIKTKDLPAPIFEVSKKGADGKYTVLPAPNGTASRVSGNLISAAAKENTHDGKVIRSVNLTLQDADDVYFVSVGETFLGRNLYNSLLGLKSFDDIEIGLYQSKPKPDAQNQTGFASVALRQHGELVRGPYDPKGDEMPKTKKVRVNGKDQTDTEELDNWFREKMKVWCKVVNSTAPKQTSSVAAPAAQDEESHAENPVPAGDGDGENEPPF